MARYHMVKKIEDIFIRFGATHERDRLADRRTDRQTDGHRMPAIAALCIAPHGKNLFTVGFCNKCAGRLLLYFSLHLKHVTTLPCETSSADMLDFQQITDDVRKRVQVCENEPDIRRPWCED